MITKSHIKYIQSLHHKKFRDENKVFIAEGPKIVEELLKSTGIVCKEVLALDEWIVKNAVLLNEYNAQKVTIIKEYELEKISALSTPNEVLAIFGQKESVELFSLKNKITLVLDNIQDPGNLGTIIRTADWFGIENIVCSNDTVDVYNAKVVQSTMGSIDRVNVIYTDLRNWLKNINDVKIYATSLKGNSINTFKKLNEAIIIIGNESNGVSNEIMNLAAEKITIPKMGMAESLNAAVASGIILSHLVTPT